jgi:hypothetical protein
MTEQDMPQIVTRNMRFPCWITNLQAHSNNMQYVLLYKDTNGYWNAPKYYIVLNIACLVQ